MEIFKEMFGAVLGLVLVYFILSLASSSISEILMEALEVRARSLQRYLLLIVGDKKIFDLVRLPQIVALRPIRYKSLFSIFGAATEPKMVENIPVPILVDAFVDLMDLGDKRNRKVSELKKTIHNMPECDGKRALQLWVQQDIVTLDELKTKLTTYFTGLLEQAKATANANARSFVVTISIIIVLLLGTDSISLARDFWFLPQARAVFAAFVENAQSDEAGVEEVKGLISEIDNLSLSIGWPQLLRYMPVHGSARDWLEFILLRVVGLGITAIFVSQGSGFWFDVLTKLK